VIGVLWPPAEICLRAGQREIYRDTGPIAAVVVGCADPRAMARFWGEATDWTLHEVTDDHALLRSAKGVGPYLDFLRTPHLKDMWNRVHLDLLPYPVDGQAAEVARLEALGATLADVGQGDVPWKVLADPEGNEFCVLGPA
jgi:Glyoxalase-like domain